MFFRLVCFYVSINSLSETWNIFMIMSRIIRLNRYVSILTILNIIELLAYTHYFCDILIFQEYVFKKNNFSLVYMVTWNKCTISSRNIPFFIQLRKGCKFKKLKYSFSLSYCKCFGWCKYKLYKRCEFCSYQLSMYLNCI